MKDYSSLSETDGLCDDSGAVQSVFHCWCLQTVTLGEVTVWVNSSDKRMVRRRLHARRIC